MKYVIIGAIIIAFLIVVGLISSKKNLKKAPERLNNAKKKFAEGESNAALKELGLAFEIPFTDKITPEYKTHLLGVLDLLKQILNDMNVSTDKMITPIYNRLNDSNGTIELEEFYQKPIKDFFENTESDEKLVEFLKKTALSGEINIVNDDNSDTASGSEKTIEFVNKAGKLILKGQPQNAIEVYNEALTQKWDQHDEAFLHDQLGSCYLMNNDLLNAEVNYKKSISIEAYFQNMWNYCDFLVYHKRKADAEIHLPELTKMIKTKSDQKEFDKLYKNWYELK
jgi:tetratricopeptide (TPR) repeat protein